MSLDRLFVGVDLTDEVRSALASHLEPHSPLPGRPAPPANWHLTLRFLGASTATQLDLVSHRLAESMDGGPFPLKLGALGAFPRPARATVLWAAVSTGRDGLRRLAAAAEDAAVAAGFGAEERPFHPHVTLSRLRPHQDVRPLLEKVAPLGARQLVTEVAVFRSHLGQPVRYEIIERIGLG